MWPIIPTAVAIGTAATFANPVGKAGLRYLKNQNWKPRRGVKRQRLDMPRSMSRGSSMSRSRSNSLALTPYGNRSGGYSGGGHYQGRLKKPGPFAKPSKYEKAGVTFEYERYGNQSLSDVCYIGATSFCHADVGKAVGLAFIRKIMKRHYQFEYSNPGQAINPTVVGVGSGPRQIVFYYEDITAADAQPTIAAGYTYTISSAATLNDFAFEFYNNVLTGNTFGQLQSGSTHPIRRLHGYQFNQWDYTISAPTETVERYSTIFPLKNQYLTVYSALTFGIQNTTTGDNGGTSTTDIDANPIKGSLFHFKDLLPRLQDRLGAYGTLSNDNSYRLQIDPNGDGIIKPEFSLGGIWTQIPAPNMFSNCDGVGKVNLAPGAIKDYKLMFKFNGTLEKFMTGFAAFEYPLQKGAFGTCCLFALEKRMPTGLAAVRVNWHYESRIGCVFGKRLGVLMPKIGSAGVSTEAD